MAMESNEVIVAMERGFAELRDEINALGQRMDNRFEKVDDELRKFALLEDMRGYIRQIAEGRDATEEKLNKHLEEGGAPLEERVIKLEFRVDTLEKKRRRN
jgi:hypothetical protein